MSENNADEKEILEEQTNTEEEIEEVSEAESEEAIEESVNETEKMEDTQEQTAANKISFINSLCAVILDEAIAGILSIALLYIADAVLKYAGYAITERPSMLLIIFIVVSVLYTSITETALNGKTFGKKFFNV